MRMTKTLKGKAYSSFFLIFTLMFIISLAGGLGLNTLRSDIYFIEQAKKTYAVSQHIKTLMLQHRRYEKDLFLNIGNVEKQKKYIASLDQKSKEIAAEIETFIVLASQSDTLDETIKSEAREVPHLYNKYFNGLSSIAAQAMDQTNPITPQQANSLMSPHKKTIHTLEEFIDEISSAVSEDFMHQVELSSDLAKNLTQALMTGTTITLILCIILSLFFVRSMIAPIANSISIINKGITQILSASEQIAQSSQALAQGASEQAATLEEQSASMQEISSMTQQNSEHFSQSEQEISEAGTEAQNSTEAMQRMSHAITNIQKSASQTSEVVDEIGSIAFQTNLLALNAAVEAARAGSAGSGFAVVADEVRNLAQRAAQAAQNSTELVGTAIRHSEEGVSISSEVDGALQNIIKRVEHVKTISSEVSTAAHQQSDAISQVNEAINQINTLTQHNASSSEESASASVELNAQSSAMMKAVEHLTELVGSKQAA